MCAGDAAAARHGRRSVAAALRVLSRSAGSAATLGASATATEERLARLSRPAGQRRVTRTLLGAGVLALVVAPLLTALAPLIADTLHHLPYCPLPLAQQDRQQPGETCWRRTSP